jgi:glyoxylase-like metal-dependent hydrolase (beta-lactamase superfamily II)
MKMFEGGRVIQILHMPGPAQGTSWVKVPDAGVLFTGDSTVVDTHPPLVDLCINEWIESLEILVSRGPAAGIIVPGRGGNADSIAIDLIVAYLTEIRATIAEHVSAGQSRLELAQYVGRFLPRFPYQDLPYDWLQRQILHGLERVYDELLLQEDGAPVA